MNSFKYTFNEIYHISLEHQNDVGLSPISIWILRVNFSSSLSCEDLGMWVRGVWSVERGRRVNWLKDSMPAVRIATRRIRICSWLNKNHEYQLHHYRLISRTAQVQSSWMDKVKNVFTGQKSTAAPQPHSQAGAVADASQLISDSDSFTLLRQSPFPFQNSLSVSFSFSNAIRVIPFLGFHLC